MSAPSSMISRESPRIRRVVVCIVFLGALFLAALWTGSVNGHLKFRLLEVRWTNDQPYLILEGRYPPFSGIMPRFNMLQREKLMVWRNGEWQLEGTPYDPSIARPIVDRIYPDPNEPLNLRIARYSVRAPFAEQWRLEIDSFETRLLGHPFFRKHVSRDYYWKSADFPGAAKMLELGLTNAAALSDYLKH